MPEEMHVVNGLGERESFRPDDYLAYYRRLRRRFLAAVEKRADSYPYRSSTGASATPPPLPAAVGGRRPSDARRGVSRAQVERPTAAEITTLEALGDASPNTRVRKMRRATFTTSATRPSFNSIVGAAASTVSICCPSSPSVASRSPQAEPGRHVARSRRPPLVGAGARARIFFGWIELDREGSRVTSASGRTIEPRRGRPSSDSRQDHRASPPLPGHARLPLCAVRGTALKRLMGEHGTRRTSSMTSSAARRSSTSTG